ncbi:MAG: DUF501 domain-containing protein [Fretibacterium sp.]|nr:DUF501 domain-containing protein [Fretibacterium sp.]
MDVCFGFPGGRTPPFFYRTLRPGELRALERRMEGHRFDPSLILGMGRPCRFGGARVLVCAPLAGLRPFPTTFWLVCPWLLRKIGTVEAHGGVRRLEDWLTRWAPEAWRPYNRDHQLLRLKLMSPLDRELLRRFRPGVLERLRLGGVGGIRYGAEIRVKCVHLQTASWLGLSRHPGEPWLVAEGLDGDCGGEMVRLCLE